MEGLLNVLGLVSGWNDDGYAAVGGVVPDSCEDRARTPEAATAGEEPGPDHDIDRPEDGWQHDLSRLQDGTGVAEGFET